MKIVIYTSITPGYDPPRDDVVNIVNDDFHDPARGVRAVKILSHRYVRADISVWIDGNVHLKAGFDPVEVLGNSDIVLVKHPVRDCLYKEAAAAHRLLRLKGHTEECERIKEQIAYYRDVLKIPPHCGVWFGGFIIRRHNHRIEQFNNTWWAEATRFGYRDQISLPVVLFRNHLEPYDLVIKLRTIDESIRDNWLFSREKHGRMR